VAAFIARSARTERVVPSPELRARREAVLSGRSCGRF